MTPGLPGIRAALLICFAAGCQSHAASCGSDAAIAESQHAWQARHLENYRFVWQQQCYCLPEAVQPIRVTVRNGEIVSAADLGGVAVSDDVRHNLKTLDALLSFAIDAQCTSEQVRITGSDAGVPTRIYVDPKRSVADDEFDVSISAFEALAP